ncbi:hypothetical protein Nepgr_016293 [Nepenthes gracilis]|uniref:Uncharacterized protein n=1 Tax=Nepenthes gracilis TaxID=150966 RepID=A0AAD3SNY0_NEPGR|nr:hypothetical protein Nepgr_016293 [Nepenthes gracilis]
MALGLVAEGFFRCRRCRLPTPDLACGDLAGQLVDRHHGLWYVLWSAQIGCLVGLTWSFWGSLAIRFLLSHLPGLDYLRFCMSDAEWVVYP